MVPRTTNNGQPLAIYSGIDLSFIVDPTTNNLVCVNTVPGSINYNAITSYNTNNYINRWDPASNTIYAAFGYNLAVGATIDFSSSSAWIDTLRYLGPR